MRASKTILSILHRGFDKIKKDGKVIMLDQQSAEILYKRLRLAVTDEGTYKRMKVVHTKTSYHLLING